VGIRSREDFEDIIRAEHHPKAFASFLLADFTKGTPSPYTSARTIADILGESETCKRAVFLVHGPPVEPVNIHAHVVVHAPGVRDCDMLSDLLRTLDHHDMRVKLNGRAYRDYRKLEREDDYAFGEWLDRCGFTEAITEADTLHDVADTLNRFSIRRAPYREGYTLVDASVPDGVAVKASRFGLSANQLLARYGNAELPHSFIGSSRSFFDERHFKYPAELRELHAAARSTWESDVAPLVDTDREAVFAERSARHNSRVSVGKALLRYAEIPSTPENIAAAVSVTQRDSRREVTRRLRAIDEAYPPQPARRVGDWLRQLYEDRPAPVATAPGAGLAPLPGQRLVEGVDMELYDDRGILIAHQDAQGVELRTLEANVTLRGATAIVAHYNLEAEDIPERLRALELAFAAPPPEPPPAVQRAVDRAAPHELNQRFFFSASTDLDEAADWDDTDELERDEDLELEAQQRRRRRGLDERRRRGR
jgi:hypothetical protein